MPSSGTVLNNLQGFFHAVHFNKGFVLLQEKLTEAHRALSILMRVLLSQYLMQAKVFFQTFLLF